MEHAHVVTSTTHKTLRGLGGIALTNSEEIAKKLTSISSWYSKVALEHVILAKAVAFGEALSPDFAEYQKQVVKNASVLANELIAQGAEIVSGGTDNHLVLVKTNNFEISGKQAENALEMAVLLATRT